MNVWRAIVLETERSLQTWEIIKSDIEHRAISTTVSRDLLKGQLGVVSIYLVVEILKDEIIPL